MSNDCERALSPTSAIMNDYSIYNIAAAALLILTAVPSVIVFLCSLCLARRHRDPARSWLTFYRAAFAFFCL